MSFGTELTLFISFLAFIDGGLFYLELSATLPDLIDLGLGFTELMSKLGILLSFVCFENGYFSLGISILLGVDSFTLLVLYCIFGVLRLEGISVLMRILF